jgi:hypothetical protein
VASRRVEYPIIEQEITFREELYANFGGRYQSEIFNPTTKSGNQLAMDFKSFVQPVKKSSEKFVEPSLKQNVKMISNREYQPTYNMELKVLVPTSKKSEYKTQKSASIYEPVRTTEYKVNYQVEYKPNYPQKYTPKYTTTYKPNYNPKYAPEYKPNYPTRYTPEYTPEYKPNYPINYKPVYEPKYTPKYTPNYNPEITKTPPVYPRYKLSYGKELRKQETFNVLVRSKGMFKTIATASTPQQAYNIGRTKVFATASASFKVISTSGKSTASIGRGLLPRQQFYESKKEPSTFIQRRSFRITTAGEKREITYKGIQMNRQSGARKKLFGGL